MKVQKTELPRKGRAQVKKISQNIPMPLWTRMLGEAGLGWGEVTQFINEAIEDRLNIALILRERGIRPEDAVKFVMDAVNEKLERMNQKPDG